MNTELIKVSGLSCGYDGKKIINDISFTVPESGFLGVLGPNGAGKTTLLRALTGLMKPMAGEILYRGKNLRDFSRAEFAREAAVLQQLTEVPFSFTVRELVLMGRYPHLKRLQKPGPHDIEAVDGAMAQADVADLKDRQINTLSGGERQRVLFAQALAQEPRVIFLDEPVSHLDIRHQVELLALLKRLNSNGMTVIAILHDLNLASEYCKTIMLLSGGAVARIGSPEEVLTYQAIEDVFKTVVVVNKNPISGKPHVLLAPK